MSYPWIHSLGIFFIFSLIRRMKGKTMKATFANVAFIVLDIFLFAYKFKKSKIKIELLNCYIVRYRTVTAI